MDFSAIGTTLRGARNGNYRPKTRSVASLSPGEMVQFVYTPRPETRDQFVARVNGLLGGLNTLQPSMLDQAVSNCLATAVVLAAPATWKKEALVLGGPQVQTRDIALSDYKPGEGITFFLQQEQNQSLWLVERSVASGSIIGAQVKVSAYALTAITINTAMSGILLPDLPDWLVGTVVTEETNILGIVFLSQVHSRRDYFRGRMVYMGESVFQGLLGSGGIQLA